MSGIVRGLYLLLAGGLLVVGLMFVFGLADSTALVAFMGVIMGAAGSVATQFVAGKVDTDRAMRLAAIERRLQAHQEAYFQYRQYTRTVHGDEAERSEKLKIAREWWDANCLYLEDRARVAVYNSMVMTDLYIDLLEAWRSEEDRHERIKARNEMRKAWGDIHLPAKVLPESVALPAIADEIPEFEEPT